MHANNHVHKSVPRSLDALDHLLIFIYIYRLADSYKLDKERLAEIGKPEVLANLQVCLTSKELTKNGPRGEKNMVNSELVLTFNTTC